MLFSYNRRRSVCCYNQNLYLSFPYKKSDSSINYQERNRKSYTLWSQIIVEKRATKRTPLIVPSLTWLLLRFYNKL